MAIRGVQHFHGVARVEIRPQEIYEPISLCTRIILLHPADGGEPTELRLFGDFSGILVTEEPQP